MATKNIVPNDNGEGGIGVTAKRWNTGFINTITGNLTGNVTGNVSGTAATVTGAAQSNITSLGNLTTLTVDDITINGSTISDAGDLLFDIGGDISLDAAGGDFIFLVGGSQYGKINFLGTNNLTISGSVADHSGLSFATHAILPAEVSATTDGTIDLGASSEQFKSIFLSGGVVVANDGTIGSAGTANAISITSGGEVEFTGGNHISGASSLRAQAKSGNLFLDTSASAQIRTNGTTTALTLDASQNATFAGNITTTDTGATVTIQDNADSTSGGTLSLENSDTSVADNHESGRIYFYGQNDGTSNSGTTQRTETVLMRGIMTDVTDGTEDSKLEIMTMSNGGQITSLTVSNDVTVGAGNLVIGTAGKGISFSAYDAGATISSNLLDDYEEGTWTPTVQSTAGGAYTVINRRGKYIKVGKHVTVQFYFIVSDVNGGTGAQITNLPFATKSGTSGDNYIGNSWNTSTGNLSSAVAAQNGTIAIIYLYNAGNPIGQGQGNTGTITYISQS